jgi:hypothetical protein
MTEGLLIHSHDVAIHDLYHRNQVLGIEMISVILVVMIIAIFMK